MATMAPAMAEIVSGKLKDSEQTAKEEKKRGVFFSDGSWMRFWITQEFAMTLWARIEKNTE